MLNRLVDIDARLRTMFALPTVPSPSNFRDALKNSVDTIEEILQRDELPEQAPASIAELLEIQMKVRESMGDRLVRSSKNVAGSVRRLGSMGAGTDLAHQICVEVVDAAAFSQAMFSTIGKCGWQVQARYPLGGIDRSEVFDWTSSSIEQECAKSHKVLATGTDWPATEPVRSILGSADYVVAPVLAESLVVGLIHASHDLPLVVDLDSVKVMDLFAAAFGAAYEREHWAQRISAHRQIVNARAAQLVRSREAVLSADLEIGSAPSGLVTVRDLTPGSGSSLDSLLTAREKEVMHLIVAGSSNAEIADMLFITVETVKSHVKKVLRKLGAVNRSEAISLYLDHD